MQMKFLGVNHQFPLSPQPYDTSRSERRKFSKQDQLIGGLHSRRSKRYATIDDRNPKILQVRNLQPVIKLKTEADIALIYSAMNSHTILNSQSALVKDNIIKKMLFYEVQQNEVIMHEGQFCNIFFVIASGELVSRSAGQDVGTFTVGGTFNSQSLVHNEIRKSSIIALTPCQLWGIDRVSLLQIIRHSHDTEYQEHKQLIDSISLFDNLTPEQKDNLISSLQIFTYLPNEVIAKEGELGDLLYIIKEGIVQRFSKDQLIDSHQRGSYFGEQQLLNNTPRICTWVSYTEVRCLTIGRQRLMTVLAGSLTQIRQRNAILAAIAKSPALNVLNQIQREQLIRGLTIRHLKTNEVVIPRYTPIANIQYNNLLIIVISGALQTEDIVWPAFSVLGDFESVQQNQTQIYQNEVVAKVPTEIAMIPGSLLQQCIGGSFIEMTRYNELIKVFTRMPLFSSLTQERIQTLIQAMQTISFDAGQVIIQQNSEGSGLYILQNGRADVYIDGIQIRTINKHDYIGERALILNKRRSATVVAKENLQCWLLDKDYFLEIIDEATRLQILNRIKLQDDTIPFENLVYVSQIGKGNFGNVFVVMNKETRYLYALKSVSRNKIGQNDLYENLKYEKDILLQLNHQFIVKLVKTFKDRDRIYFLMELVRGIDFNEVLCLMNDVSTVQAKFYVSTLLLVLEYLHERNIVYRDLKPENVMIDESGYPKLVDFGTSKLTTERTYSSVGTPQYMAIEVIQNRGYNHLADYWSLGIIVYEILYGVIPFGEDAETPMEVYEEILQYRLTFPSNAQPADVMFIKQLLQKNPSMRTGGSIEALKSHEWFEGINWESLLSRQVEPPFRPNVQSYQQVLLQILKEPNRLLEKIRVRSSLDRGKQ